VNASPFIRIALLAGVSALAASAPSVVADTPAPAASAKPADSAAPAGGAKEKEGVFTLVNKTTWEIAEVHVTPAEEDTWTGNLLKHKLAPGATAKMTVVCDETDVKLVDAKGHTCVNESMYPCGRHSTWTVTNESIAGCKTFGQ
jgi:hypothetical protein